MGFAKGNMMSQGPERGKGTLVDIPGLPNAHTHPQNPFPVFTDHNHRSRLRHNTVQMTTPHAQEAWETNPHASSRARCRKTAQLLP